MTGVSFLSQPPNVGVVSAITDRLILTDDGGTASELWLILSCLSHISASGLPLRLAAVNI